MKKKVKILITSAGSTNAVNVIKALKKQKEIKFFIVSADINPLSAGFFLADGHYVVPRANSKSFISEIIRICKKEKIEIIIPTFSEEIFVFSKNKEKLEKAGVKMAISDCKTFNITENKLKTDHFFKGTNIPTPKIYTEKEIKKGDIKFPVIVKPVKSSGSKGVLKINNLKELSFFINHPKDKLFVQEYISGLEYTIDGICDLNGKMIACSPRVRLETKSGLAVKSVTVSNPLMADYARKISEGLKIVGPFNMQCFEKNEKIKFIEVNSRFPSGGLPLTVKAGLNIPLMVVKILLGKKIKIPKVRAGLTMVRYWDSIVLGKKGDKYFIYE